MAWNYHNFDDHLLKEIECPVCLRHMRPPIYICKAGHSICNSCKNRIHICPVCRKIITATRNVTLEKMSNKLRHSCKYKDYGCPHSATLNTLIPHENICEYHLSKCPVWVPNNPKCDWIGVNVMAHIRTTHPTAIQGRDITLPDFTMNNSDKIEGGCNILEEFGKIFRCVYYKYGTNFYCVVQLVGKKNDLNNFIYTAEFSCERSMHKIIFKLPCSCFKSENNVFPPNNSFLVIPINVLGLVSMHKEIKLKIYLETNIFV